jgi:hypothetical protein
VVHRFVFVRCHSAGSLLSGRIEHQATNLGVGSSNLSGRAIKSRISKKRRANRTAIARDPKQAGPSGEVRRAVRLHPCAASAPAGFLNCERGLPLRRIRLSRFRLFGFWPYSIVRLRRSFRRGNADHHTVQRDRNHVRFHSEHCSTLTLNGSVAIDPSRKSRRQVEWQKASLPLAPTVSDSRPNFSPLVSRHRHKYTSERSHGSQILLRGNQSSVEQPIRGSAHGHAQQH